MSHTTDSDGSSGQPKKAGLFDIRNIIGALMALYGVILTLAGLLGEHEPRKTGDVNANLWTGLCLLALGLEQPADALLDAGEGQRPPRDDPLDDECVPVAVAAQRPGQHAGLGGEDGIPQDVAQVLPRR